MRRKRFTQWLALLAVAAFTLSLASSAWAESGCHKTKGKACGGSNNIVQTLR